jgi:hypothetical protein
MSGTRITRIPLDPMALRGGYLAGRRGITDEANPYQAGAPAALAWRIGWVSGLKKQLRVMYGGRSVFTGRFRNAPFPLVSIKPRPSRRSVENCVGLSAASSRPPLGADLASAGARRGPCIADASS